MSRCVLIGPDSRCGALIDEDGGDKRCLHRNDRHLPRESGEGHCLDCSGRVSEHFFTPLAAPFYGSAKAEREAYERAMRGE